MKIIDIYYQGEGVGALEHLEFDAEETFATLQAAIVGKHNIAGEIVLFIEDEAECYSACNIDPLSWGIGVQN